MKIIPLLLISLTLLANNNDDTLNLLEDLDNASQISTRTKLNINKSPAIVSILHADELQKIGITDLYTALETVPGIEISMGSGGAKQINMRGNKSLVTDKLKFMIDGVSINAQLSGANHFYLNMPIENIERIEIIRGPASALYGSFAHIGVINVITKVSTHKKGVFFVRGSSEHASSVGFTQHFNTKNIKVAFSGSFVNNNKEREYRNYSLLPTPLPFTSAEDFQTKSLAMHLDLYNDFSFTSRYLENTTQNHFGYGAWPIVQDPKNLVHTSFINEAVYAPQLTQELSLEFKAGYKTYSMVGESRLLPYSILQPKPPYPSYDLIGDGNYKENTLYSDLALSYHYEQHNIIVGAYISRTQANGTSYYINNPATSELPTISIPGGGLKDNIERKQYAFYFSDIYSLTETLSFNFGLRYDHFNDTDNALNPKLSLVYAYDEKQSYKLMYQRSFRAPSFVELYGTQAPFIGDENLKSETMDTYELAYRYQNTFDSWFGVNFFYSHLKDFIYRDPTFTLKNGHENISYGSEIEFKLPLHETTTLQANYSYVHMEDSNGKKTPLIANQLANFMLFYQISHNWNTGTKIRYVGKRSRQERDTRDALASYTTFDQTLTYTNDALTLQASVKNLFNKDVRYPAPLGNGITSGTYKDDLQRDGRVFWLSAQWRFQ